MPPSTLTAAFDCDGTLITYDNEVNARVVEYARGLHALGFRIIVWSGGGQRYAESVMHRCGLADIATAHSKTESKQIGADIAFDDQNVNLAKVNILVTRPKYD